jgi:hypothetical protein
VRIYVDLIIGQDESAGAGFRRNAIETARLPGGRIAAMKPDPLALTSLAWQIGSPLTR